MTQPDYDSAKAQFDASQGQVTAAQAAVAQAQQALDDCEVRAPLDGQILARNIELGVLVAAGDSAFTMGETSTVKAVFGVPDTVLPSVKLGQKQAIVTESYTQSFMGLVTAVSPQAESKSRTFASGSDAAESAATAEVGNGGDAGAGAVEDRDARGGGADQRDCFGAGWIEDVQRVCGAARRRQRSGAAAERDARCGVRKPGGGDERRERRRPGDDQRRDDRERWAGSASDSVAGDSATRALEKQQFRFF